MCPYVEISKCTTSLKHQIIGLTKLVWWCLSISDVQMDGNTITNQQNEQIHAQQQEIQNLNAALNQKAGGIHDMNQNLVNQAKPGVAGVGNAQDGQLPSEPQDPTIFLADLVHQPPIAQQNVCQAPPMHVQDPQGGVYTLEQFIKKLTKAFKGTTYLEKVEAWTLNMLNSFRAMEVLKEH